MRVPRRAAAQNLLRAARVLARAIETPVSGAAVPTSADTLHRLAGQLTDLARGVNVNAVFDPPKSGRPRLERENRDCAYTYLKHRVVAEASNPTAAQRVRLIEEAVAAANATRATFGLPPAKRAAIERYAHKFRAEIMAILEAFEELDTSAFRAFLKKQSRRPE